MLDLNHATRDELIAQALSLRDALADQDRRRADLEVELARQREIIAQLTAQADALMATAATEDDPGSGTPKIRLRRRY